MRDILLIAAVSLIAFWDMALNRMDLISGTAHVIVGLGRSMFGGI
jgi:hypothetical protein